MQNGDNVIIYMGVIPESIIAMLACSRIGAIHSVVNTDLSSIALSERINHLSCRLLITQDYVFKKGNQLDIRSKVDSALKNTNLIEKVILFRRLKVGNKTDSGKRNKLAKRN